MYNTSRGRWAAAIIVFVSGLGLAFAQSGPSVEEILAKNLEASGGQEKLAQVKNMSFRTGAMRQIVTAAGELKVLTGRDPVVTEIIRVRGGKVDRSSLSGISEVTGPQKTIYQTLAKIYAGAFSLLKFSGQLKFEGLKSYGPEKFYHLTTNAAEGPISAHLFLRADDYRLKRLVFQGTTIEGDKYEVNYDFAPFEEAEELQLPLSWFASQVGTRGNLAEVTEVKVNQPLAADFFSDMNLNIGAVKAGPGSLEGNVLEVNSFPNGLFVITNWTKKDVEKTGFKNREELTLMGGDQANSFIMRVVFYATAGEFPRPGGPPSGPPGEVWVLGPAPRGGATYVLQLMGPSARDLALKMTPLTPISVTRKTE